MNFDHFKLSSELIRAISEMGFVEPTPVQEKLIPLLRSTDTDVIGLAQTGTGKTAAFGLPLLQKLVEGVSEGGSETSECENSTWARAKTNNRHPRLLILCPTRELCIQITEEMSRYAEYLPGLSITPVYGGAGIAYQITAVRKGTDIIVATPGRLLDLIKRGVVTLSAIEYLVLDEADIMLDMGFKDELDAILSTVPGKRQTVLLSATMPDEVARIAADYMYDPVEVVVGKKNAGTESVEHSFVMVRKKDKYPALKRLVDFHPEVYGIVFCRTKADTQEIADRMIQDGYDSEALHGDLSQAQREWVMKKFRDRHLRLLVATDVAARGLDVENLTHIIHYSIPDDPTIYTHRSGRTGRAGKTGCSISIITDRELQQLRRIERALKRDITESAVPRGTDICERQLLHMIDEIKNTSIDHDRIAPFMPAIVEKLAGLDRETLIKHFVTNEFSRFLQYYKNSSDLSSVAPTSEGKEKSRRGNHRQKGGSRNETHEFSPIKINIGKNINLRPEQVIGLINKTTRNRHIGIGRIDIEQGHSVIAVEKGYLSDVLEALEYEHFKGIEIRVEVAPQHGFETNGKSRKKKRRNKSVSNSGESGWKKPAGSKSHNGDRVAGQKKKRKKSGKSPSSLTSSLIASGVE